MKIKKANLFDQKTCPRCGQRVTLSGPLRRIPRHNKPHTPVFDITCSGSGKVFDTAHQLTDAEFAALCAETQETKPGAA